MANKVSKETEGKSLIDYIIGMPPGRITDEAIMGRTETVMKNSMPIAHIYPGVPGFKKGSALYQRKPAFNPNDGRRSYTKLLNAHGVILEQPGYSTSTEEGCIAVAYIADSFPTDSFTNEYGENFLQGLTNIASEGAASIAQMKGAEDLYQVLQGAVNTVKGTGKAGEAVGTFAEKMGSGAMKMMRSILPQKIMGGVDIVARLAAGARIDFPMLWKGSGFQPSYTMTIRLYNPAPGDPDITNKFITAPIAALLLLAVPHSADGFTYQWPFIHRIVSPGIYNLDPAFISNITIVKGGDQQQIAYSQRLGVVDVRIDFGSMFSSMIASIDDPRTRPTLKTYLEAMTGTNQKADTIKNFSTNPADIFKDTDQARLQREEEEKLLKKIEKTKNQAPTSTETTTEDKDNPPSRVTTALKTIGSNLRAQIPFVA